MKKLTLPPVAAALLLSLIACQSTPQATNSSPDQGQSTEATAMPGKGVKVRSGTGPVYFGRFVTEVIDIGLENLGYETEEIKQLNPSVLLVAIGNGELDFFPTHLEKSQEPLFEKAGGAAKLERVGLIIPQKIVQGYQIDKKTAEQYKITNIEQLKDPEIAKLFDSDGDGKANLAGCEVGQPCEQVVDHHLQTYGLQNTVEQDKGTEQILMSDVMARYKQGKPVLYRIGNLSWTGVELKPDQDVVWLEVPSTSLPNAQKEVTEKDTSVDGKNLGFIVDSARIAANKKFLEANPAAKRWLEQVQIPAEDITAFAQVYEQGENSPEDIRRYAEEWVKNNQQTFDNWLEEARKAGSTSS